jgi:phosphodiesterase/alkaline phosphatase D-like protein
MEQKKYIFNLLSILIIFLAFFSSCNFFEKEFLLPTPIAREALEVKSTSFVAQWDEVRGATSYEVDVAKDSAFGQMVEKYNAFKVEDSASLLVDDIEAGATYYYRVRAKISNQTSSNSNTIKVATSALQAPTTFAATDVSSTSFKAIWSKVAEANAYLIDIATDENFTNIWGQYNAQETTDTTLIINDLKVNQKYFYRVRAKQATSISSYSNVQTVFTSTLATPQVLDPSDAQLTSFTAHWGNVEGATVYHIDVATDVVFRSILPNYSNRSVTNNSLVIANLDANATYYYRVRAANSETTSNHSDVMVASTGNLTAPVATAASGITTSSFVANWQNTDNASLFLLDVALDQGFTQVITGYQAKEVIGTNSLVENLPPNTSIYYRVRVKALNTISDYSNTIQVMTLPLSAPVAVDPTDHKAFSMMAQWDKLSDVDAYLVDVSTDPNFSTFLSGYQGKTVLENSLLITDLDFRTTYYYRVRAKRLEKYSGYSNVITVPPTITPNCRVTKLEHNLEGVIQEHSQTFEYDALGRVEKITNGYGNSHFIFYKGNTQVVDNVVFRRGSDNSIIETFTYEYNGDQIKTIMRYRSNGDVKQVWDFSYDTQGRIETWIVYPNLSRNYVVKHRNYLYNAKGNVYEVTNSKGKLVRQYSYDQALSPYRLFNPLLAYFIRTTRNDSQWFLPLNNPIREEILDSSDVPGFTGSKLQISLFYLNSKDLAYLQEGHYGTTYTLQNCD